MANDKQLVLRVPGEALDRAERIRAKVERRTRLNVTRSEVLRRALLRGLDILERDSRKR